MTIQDIFKKYKPKEEFSIYAFQSKHTQKYIACIFKKIAVNRFAKEFCDGSIKNINEVHIEKYLNELKPYIEERKEMPSDVAKFPRTPAEAYQKE